ncbi:MAG: hypothetical protein ACRC2O_08610 [Chitinophagaceae bacterium]
MQLQHAVNNAFIQLAGSLEFLTPDQYILPCKNLSNSTIGQHVRHIIEMFQCLEIGYESGFVNYEKRKRDQQIETNKDFALGLLHEIYSSLNKADKPLILEGVYNDDSSQLMQFATNYYREIVYNLEHTIHHMALIRVGLTELTLMELPDNYGMASATIKHKKSCAQ